MPEDKFITAIILAAGKSSRMGRTKQLLPWKESTLIESVIIQFQKSKVDEVVVVLGNQHELIQKSLSNLKNLRIVVNKNPDSGMLSSIQTGISSSYNSSAAIIGLVDQPAVDDAYINLLIEKNRDSNKSLVATNYKNSVGVPALFGKEHFDTILQLSREAGGAKAYIQQKLKNVKLVEPDFELFDIDTEDDYKFYYQKFHQS
ncbi:molybdenum cofactor cytidylyltransferase [Flavobacteriaceae bacterium MAR_2010_188]|nr:molybdenum cofactor cytidylyltransferase [Flavobacteriaceae bacterium MAR_2010_188]